MSGHTTKSRDFSSIVEKYYPPVLSAIVVPILILIGTNPTLENVDKIVDASINIASILIGFHGALLGVLISVQDRAVVKLIFESVKREEIFSFIRYAIFSGFFTLISAATLYVHIKTVTNASYYFFNVWLFLAVNFLLSSYRIIDILMYLLSVRDIKIERPPSKIMEKDAAEDLKQQFSRKKE
jgi:hypothetical protein